MNPSSTNHSLIQSGEWLGVGNRQPSWGVRSSGEVRSLALDTGVLDSSIQHQSTTQIRVRTYQMVKEWVIDDTKSRSTLINQTDRDTGEREAMNEIGRSIWVYTQGFSVPIDRKSSVYR